MSEYKTLFGKAVKALASDPTDAGAEGQIWYNTTTGSFRTVLSSGVWTSSANLPTGRDYGTAGGIQTAGFIAGGELGPGTTINTTFDYDGSSWTASGAMGTTRQRMNLGVSGTQTAGLGVGGHIPPSAIYSAVEEYNGSIWTAGTSLPVATQQSGGAGPETSYMMLGTNPDRSEGLSYNGSAWSAEGSSSQGFAYGGLAGQETAALAFYGATSPAGTNRSTGEEYNGTAWTTIVPSLPDQGNSGGAGGTTSAAVFAGAGTTARYWDGTTVAATTSMANPRANYGSIGGSPGTFVAAGGNGDVSATEEFNFSTSTVTPAAWSSGGNLNTSRRDGASAGNATAHSNALYFSGYEPANSAKSEAYDGTSWSEGPDLSTGRGGARGFGVNTAAVCCAGGNPPSQNVTEEYNGSAWTAGGNLNLGRTSHNAFGTLTAGVASGGNEVGPAGFTTATELYDGTSWTTSPATLPTAMHQGGIDGAGSQTAGLVAGGDGPGSPTTAAYEFDGGAWTAGGSLLTGAEGAGMNGTQTAAFFTGGNNGGALNTTQAYDGTSWSTRPSISTARFYTNGSGATAPATLLIGGWNGTANLATTEEFTGEVVTVNPASNLSVS